MMTVRWGGLGICSVVSLASSAEFTMSLLLTRLHDHADSEVATAMLAWIMDASCPSISSTSVIFCYPHKANSIMAQELAAPF
jgi:hypothetical protein